jgi:hypothetical protein
VLALGAPVPVVPLTLVPFLLELLHAARTRAITNRPMSARGARANRSDEDKVRPLRSTMSTGVETKNGAWMRSCRRVNEE